MEEKLQKDMHALSDPKLVKHGGLWRTEAEAAAGQGGYMSKVEASIEYLRTTQPPEFKALMVKYEALRVERMNQGDGLDDGPDEWGGPEGMVDIDVNTGLDTTDSNMSRVTGVAGKRTKDLCMTACNKFPACKSFVIGPSDVPGAGRACHLKSEQAGGMTVPSTTHNMWFKERGGFQRVSTPEESEKSKSRCYFR